MGKQRRVVRQRSLGNVAQDLADRFRRNNWHIGSQQTVRNLALIVHKEATC